MSKAYNTPADERAIPIFSNLVRHALPLPGGAQ
jgi:hypothetical protein